MSKCIYIYICIWWSGVEDSPSAEPLESTLQTYLSMSHYAWRNLLQHVCILVCWIIEQTVHTVAVVWNKDKGIKYWVRSERPHWWEGMYCHVFRLNYLHSAMDRYLLARCWYFERLQRLEKYFIRTSPLPCIDKWTPQGYNVRNLDFRGNWVSSKEQKTNLSYNRHWKKCPLQYNLVLWYWLNMLYKVRLGLENETEVVDFLRWAVSRQKHILWILV